MTNIRTGAIRLVLATAALAAMDPRAAADSPVAPNTQKTQQRPQDSSYSILSGNSLDRRNEATEMMAGPEENEANRAMHSIKPQISADVVKRQVVEFLDKYPGTKRRRDVRARLMQAYVLGGRSADAVEECMYQTSEMPGSVLGDMTVRDGWVQLASLFAKEGRLDSAARVRMRIVMMFPYQLENRGEICLAMTEFAKAGLREDALAAGKLALAILPEAESAKALETVKQLLVAMRGPEVADQFEAYWQHGPASRAGETPPHASGSNPLAEIRLPGRELLQEVSKADLRNKALLLESSGGASMQRGVLYLFAGDYSLAARELQEAVATARPDQKDTAADQAGIYFRWIDGSAARARLYRAFVRYGGRGPDGVASTADDLVNPFTQAQPTSASQ